MTSVVEAGARRLHAGAGAPPPGTAGTRGWAGGLRIDPGALTFTGAIGAAPAHAHAAVQVIDLHHGHMLLRDTAGTTRAATAAVIPTGVRHGIVTTADAAGIMRLLDPGSTAARTATARLRDNGGDPATVDTWLAAARYSDDEAGHTAPSDDLHPALARALAAAADLVHSAMTLTDLAGRVGISPSRLGHLFAEQLGLSFPAWRRWTRLQHAVGQVAAGTSLTMAAHAAGFADSAHLTRTCRAMFGLSPTEALQATGWLPHRSSATSPHQPHPLRSVA
jgi:AraC-like DNA-binding protein